MAKAGSKVTEQEQPSGHTGAAERMFFPLQRLQDQTRLNSEKGRGSAVRMNLNLVNLWLCSLHPWSQHL